MCYFCFFQVDMLLATLSGYIATTWSGLRLTSADCLNIRLLGTRVFYNTVGVYRDFFFFFLLKQEKRL